MRDSHGSRLAESPGASLLPTVAQLLTRLATIAGQEEAKRVVCTAVYHHYLAGAVRELDHLRLGHVRLGSQHVLLMGPSGTGKTLLVSSLAQALGVPFFRVSATSLVEVGYKGLSVDEMLAGCVAQCGGNIKRVEQGILFIDEVDKIAGKPLADGQRDVSGVGVQNALLAVLDGRLAEGSGRGGLAPGPTLDTSRMLCIFAGAFEGLLPLIQQRLAPPRRRVGWLTESGAGESDPAEQSATGNSSAKNGSAATGPGETTTLQSRTRATASTRTGSNQAVASGGGGGGAARGGGGQSDELLDQVSTEDLIEYGMIRELVGRWSAVAVLRGLTEGDLVRILETGPSCGALATQRVLAQLHGIELVITPEGKQAIARRALELGLGARGLTRVVGEVLRGVAWRWSELADAGVTAVRIDDAVVRGAGEPRKFVEPQRRYKRQDMELRQIAGAALTPQGEASGGPPKGDQEEVRALLEQAFRGPSAEEG